VSTLKQSFIRHELIAVFVGVLSVLSAAVFWWQFETSQNELRANRLLQAEKRAVQLAEALSDQAELLLGNTDFALRELRDAWVTSRANFDATVDSLQATYPDKSVVHVAVIGADGYVVFSTRGVDGRVFAGDREHFKAHADNPKADTLHVSKPLYGRVSKEWNILISRPILRRGTLSGVMIIGLSPKYLSKQLGKINLSPGDTVVLLHKDGEYLARSPDWENALGKSVRADRPFLAKDAQESGIFYAPATLDQKSRIFGWHRLRANGLIIVVGLDQGTVLGPFEKQYDQENIRIKIIIVVMAFFGSGIALLLLRLARRQEALRASEERWKFALEGAGDGVWDWNNLTNRVALSRRWKEQLGYTEAEIGDDLDEWSKRVHPEDMVQVMADLQHHLDGKTPAYVNEHRMLCKDGSWKWILDRGMVVRRAPDGKALRVIGTHSDISERRRADDVLRESESKYRRLIESSPDIVYVFSSQRGGIFYSPRVEAVLGYKPDQFYARPFLWSESIHPDDVAAVKRAVASAEGGKSFAVEYRIKDARGAWHWFLDRSTEVQTANGELLIEGLVTDITERKQIEDRNRQINVELEQQVAQRTRELQIANRELESFSYSVSHDLRAPLRAIEGFSSLLESEYASQLDGRAKDYFRRIRGAATRMARLIDDLLNLSRISRQEMHHGQVNLSALAQEAADELKASEPERRVEWVIAPQVSAEGDSGLMRIALQNLMGNAWKYSSKREIARIEFGVGQWNGHPAFFVRDDGEGFDMAHADKLFGAFQRLHSAQEFPGTGIGLATVARIIRRHGGAVGAEGKVHEGATFYFTL
jgi:PAS domain S-box-containing protein